MPDSIRTRNNDTLKLIKEVFEIWNKYLQCRYDPGSHITSNGVSNFKHSAHFEHQLSSVQFSRSVVSDSLRSHESQHARPPCPSPSPGVHLDSHLSSWWCHPAISSSVIPFSSRPQSLPASESFPMKVIIEGIKWWKVTFYRRWRLGWALWTRQSQQSWMISEEHTDKCGVSRSCKAGKHLACPGNMILTSEGNL